MNDDELQSKIENKEFSDISDDAKAYKRIFDALEKDPYELSPIFADKVIQRIETKRGSAKDNVWLGIGIFCLVIAGIATSMLLDFKINFGAFKFISGYAGLIIFGTLFILAFQWVDKNIFQKNIQL